MAHALLGLDVNIFCSAEKKLWIKKYSDTCGRGMNLRMLCLTLASSVRTTLSRLSSLLTQVPSTKSQLTFFSLITIFKKKDTS